MAQPSLDESRRLARALGEIRARHGRGGEIAAWRLLPEEPAAYGEVPAALDPRLAARLGEWGVPRLYAHQAAAVRAALAGQDVAVVTPTASGKTLCYNLPVLQALLEDPSARALYLFPTKALAHDQLSALAPLLESLGLEGIAAAYDGDTPTGRRPRVRDGARLVISNPDMLHAGILPAHTRWRDTFAHLRYLVVDEMHQYRGVFGSHVANVLRRLERICAFYGSRPQVLLSSATIANPAQLAERLTGRRVTLIATSGAPRGRRNMVFYNPPIVDETLGIRRSPSHDAGMLARTLLVADAQTVVFCRSRLGVELLLAALRREAAALGLDPAAVRGYRGGYLPRERREIERGLREGTVRVVVATNALELGVDIGGMSACVMVGYPGTIASTWQQAGRAGRGTAESAAFLVAGDNPLDQYLVSHPDYLLGRSPEHALVNPGNLSILLAHLRCAAYELPIEEGEPYGGEDVTPVLEYLAEEGSLARGGGRWRWAGLGYPAGDVSLRSAESVQVAIVAEDPDGRRETVGLVDRSGSSLYVYEGAVYLHEGQQYLVEAFDWEGALARVRPVRVDYYTQASVDTRIAIERAIEEAPRPAYSLTLGEVTLTTRVTGYRKLRMGTQEHLGWGDVDLPEQSLLTYAAWMVLPEDLVARLRAEGWWEGEHVVNRGPSWPAAREAARRRDGYRCQWCGAEERPGLQHHVHHLTPFREAGWVPGENENHEWANRLENLITLCPRCHRLAEQSVAAQSTLSSLGRVFGHLIPLHAMCDRHDVGILSEVLSPQTRAPTLWVYDAVPLGVGLAEAVVEMWDDLLVRAAELVHDCPCAAGCPSCIGAGAIGNPRAKEQVLRLVEALREG